MCSQRTESLAAVRKRIVALTIFGVFIALLSDGSGALVSGLSALWSGLQAVATIMGATFLGMVPGTSRELACLMASAVIGVGLLCYVLVDSCSKIYESRLIAAQKLVIRKLLIRHVLCFMLGGVALYAHALAGYALYHQIEVEFLKGIVSYFYAVGLMGVGMWLESIFKNHAKGSRA